MGLRLELDASDVDAAIARVQAATHGWDDDRCDALARDMDALLDKGEGVDVRSEGTAVTMTVSGGLLDVFRQHGI